MIVAFVVVAGLTAWVVLRPGGDPDGPQLLVGDPASLALEALVDQAQQPAAPGDIVNGLILDRLDVAIAADATIGQVNAALEAVGGGIVSMHAGLPALTISVPRQDGAAELTALADTLKAQPGIRAVLLGRTVVPNEAPPAPADADAAIGYLQQAHFPAAWNARAAASGVCQSSKVTVIVADFFGRPIDAGYSAFAGQVPGVSDLGIGSVDPADLITGRHGYDVVTTLAARLDGTVPTGAFPYPECLAIKAVQLNGLTALGASFAIDGALTGTFGRAIVNASYSFLDACAADPCAPENLTAQAAFDRAIQGAVQRALLGELGDNVLVVSAAGNDADQPIASVYPGAGLARVSSAYNVAATADSAMSFLTDAALWDPTSPCPSEPCLPSLSATADQVAALGQFLADLGLASAAPASNVMIVGSSDASLNPSAFSDPGADVLAVGEGIPTLAGAPTRGTSFAAPQVAGLAAYLWALSPELRARPVQDTIGAIQANASSAVNGIIDAYATVLSLDVPGAVTPATAPMRLAILDLDADLDFDVVDLQAFHDVYVNSVGQLLEPPAQDYSRRDINGDGFTGGTRTAPMDLDPTGSRQFGAPELSVAVATVGGVGRVFNETAITDGDALCYYASTGLFTGSSQTLALRDDLVDDLCPRLEFTFVTDLDGWTPGVAGPVGQANWGTADHSNKGPGVVKLDGAGEPTAPNSWISRTITLPPNATSLAFDVSAQDALDADSELRVRLVEGVNSHNLLIEIVAGVEGSLTFAPRTLDISPWAGRTVTIFFEQNDNGLRGQFPGSRGQLYLDNVRILLN